MVERRPVLKPGWSRVESCRLWYTVVLKRWTTSWQKTDMVFFERGYDGLHVVVQGSRMFLASMIRRDSGPWEFAVTHIHTNVSDGDVAVFPSIWNISCE